MKDQQTPTKKRTVKKVAIFTLAAAAGAYAALAWMNRDADPTTWKGERSGYEETK